MPAWLVALRFKHRWQRNASLYHCNLCTATACKPTSLLKKLRPRLLPSIANATSSGAEDIRPVTHSISKCFKRCLSGDRVVVRVGTSYPVCFSWSAQAEWRRPCQAGYPHCQRRVRPIATALKLAATATLPPEARWTASSQLAGTIHAHNLSPASPCGRRCAHADRFTRIPVSQLELLKTTLDASLIRQRADRLQQAGRTLFRAEPYWKCQSRRSAGIEGREPQTSPTRFFGTCVC